MPVNGGINRAATDVSPALGSIASGYLSWRSCWLGPPAYPQERLKAWLASVVVSLRENAVREALVNARRVLGHLGFGLILQVNPGHLG